MLFTEENGDNMGPASNEDDGGSKDYTWLILAIVGSLILIAVIVIIIVVLKRKQDDQKKENYVEQVSFQTANLASSEILISDDLRTTIVLVVLATQFTFTNP